MGRLTTTLLLLSFVPCIRAQWTTDLNANTTVRAMTTGEANSPMVADGPEGSTYVSWFENPGGNYNLHMQRLDAGGNLLWGDAGLVVSSHPQNTAIFRYDLQTDGEGNAIVAFQDERTGTLDIVAYKIGPDGSFLWGADGVQLPTPQGTGLSPRVAALSNGNTVVAWNTDHNPGRVGFQLIGPTGNTMLAQTFMLLFEHRVSRPVPIATSDGGFIMQFELEGAGFPSPATMYALRFDAAAAMAWTTPVQVSTRQITSFFFPQPVSDGHDGFYLAYNTGNPTDADLTDVYLQRVRGNGTLWDAEGTRLDEDNVTQKFTAGKGVVLVDDDHGLMVPLQVTDWSQGESGVFVQRVDTAGGLPWGLNARPLVPIGPEFTSPMDIAATDDGAVIVHATTGGFNQTWLAATRVDLDGNAVWSPAQRDVCTLASGKDDVAMGSVSGAQAVVVWWDGRPPQGIYAQNILDLDFGTGVGSIRRDGAAFLLEQNPATQPTLLAAPSVEARPVEVFDTHGHLVHGTVFPAFATRMELPLARLARGVYTIRAMDNGKPVVLRWVK